MYCCYSIHRGSTAEAIAEREILAGRFQQVTSPVMAKGVEDTSFYVWVPLGSVNEVGGDPRRPTTSPKQFHEHNVERVSRYRQAMLATTTHDTKRTEDVRARLNVLSEIPADWRTAVQRFSRLNKRWRREVDGEPGPDRQDEYLFYQSVPRHLAAGAAVSAERRAASSSDCKAIWKKPRTKPSSARAGSIPAAPTTKPSAISWTRRSASRRKTASVLSCNPLHERIADAGPVQRPLADRAEAAFARRARHLSRPGVLGLQPRRSRQSPTGRTYDARRAARRRLSIGQRRHRRNSTSATRVSSCMSRIGFWTSGGDCRICGPAATTFRSRPPACWRIICWPLPGAERKVQQLQLVVATPRFVQKLIDAERAGMPSPAQPWPLPRRIWEGTFIVLAAGNRLSVRHILHGCTVSGWPSRSYRRRLLGDFPIGVMEACTHSARPWRG